jgi:hypothetical protein
VPRKSTKEWPGELGKKGVFVVSSDVRQLDLPPDLTPGARHMFEKVLWKEEERMLQLLRDHFGIPLPAELRNDAPQPSDVDAQCRCLAAAGMMYRQLSIHLARECVPACQELKPGGRPNKWHTLVHAYLVVQMDELIKPGDRMHGAKWAAKQLAKRYPWDSIVDGHAKSLGGGEPSEALLRQYHEARRDDVVKDALRVFRNADDTAAARSVLEAAANAQAKKLG